ncbi:hypothetical protein H4R33_004205 [Dimargaris cristalligena]|nr:hypothetical protein H4R33_004205 [Dimargaris cristalligena]
MAPPMPMVGLPPYMPPGYPAPFPPMPATLMKPRLPKAPPCNVPNSTLYLSNLNEKIKIPALKEALRKLYEPHGKIVEIVAHGNLRMRGQAFVVFEDEEAATKALEATKQTILFDKPILVQYARTNSFSTVKRKALAETNEDGSTNNDGDEDGEGDSEDKVEAHVQAYKKQHREAKEKRDQERQAALEMLKHNPYAFAMGGGGVPMVPPGALAPGAEGMGGQMPGGGMPPVGSGPMAYPPGVLPPHMLGALFPGMPHMAGPPAVVQPAPPNKILFLQNLTSEITETMLRELFEKYDGFMEVRLVPGKSDIAFVEYEEESQAVDVKKQLGDQPTLNDHSFQIDYAKR